MPRDQRGFSLIELIASMVLVGILAAVGSGGVIYLARGFAFTKENNDALNRAQLAMSRLTKEFRGIKAVTSANGTSIAYITGRSDETDVAASVFWDGAAGHPLTYTIDGGSKVMIDQVQNFSLRYYDHHDGISTAVWSSTRRIIEIELVMKAAENTNTRFTTRVTMQNLYP